MGTGSRSGTVTRLGGIVFVTLLCTAVTAAAQTAVTLSGKVLDASGASVADAAVRVNIGGSVAAETQTDANGQFEVRVNADGAREILVTAPGFAPFSTTVQPSTRSGQRHLIPRRCRARGSDIDRDRHFIQRAAQQRPGHD